MDIVVIDTGEIRILDQDELDEALDNGEITREAYDHAESVCRKLYAYLLANRNDMIAWCEQSYRALKAQLG